MKKGIFILIIFGFFLRPVLAEDVAPPQILGLNITILNALHYPDYRFIIEGIQKMTGVSEIIETKASPGEIRLKGTFSSDPASFLNDVQVLVMDRFGFETKSTNTAIYVTLKKL